MKLFFRYAFYSNRWLWFHMLGGALIAKFFQAWAYSTLTIFSIVLFTALLWEIIEYIRDDVKKVYGSYLRWFYDSVGDIIGALIMTGVVLL